MMKVIKPLILLNNANEKMNDTEILEKIDYKYISTGVNGSGEEEDFAFSDIALEEIQKIIVDNNIPTDFYLRINTKSAGCLGMTFYLGFDPEIHDNDRIYSINSINIAVDAKSLFYLMGVKINFVSNEKGKGFVFEQPNNFKTCGCNS